jgi:hypothetical protein
MRTFYKCCSICGRYFMTWEGYVNDQRHHQAESDGKEIARRVLAGLSKKESK